MQTAAGLYISTVDMVKEFYFSANTSLKIELKNFCDELKDEFKQE